MFLKSGSLPPLLPVEPCHFLFFDGFPSGYNQPKACSLESITYEMQIL